MKRELERLLEAFDLRQEATGAEAGEREAELEARLEAVLERYPNLSKETLRRAIRARWANYVRAQRKPSSMPPQAYAIFPPLSIQAICPRTVYRLSWREIFSGMACAWTSALC
jgi:hypothetical protein